MTAAANSDLLLPRSNTVASSSPTTPKGAIIETETDGSHVVVKVDALQRWVAARAVVLLAIAMLTGGWAGIALAGKVVVPIPHLALAAHLNALLGCFWLLGFAFTLPMLSYSDKAKQRLAWLQMIPNYGNWFVTLIASVLGVRGLELKGELANDIIAVALIVVVVIPALIGTFAWAWGFRKKPA